MFDRVQIIDITTGFLWNRFDYSYPELKGFYYISSAAQLGGGVHGGAGVAVTRMILGKKLKL